MFGRPVGLALLVLVGTAPATAATDDETVTTPPQLSRHGVSARHVCFAGAQIDTGSGATVIDPAPCTRIYAPLPVRVGDQVDVRTPTEATAVRISIDPRHGPRRVKVCKAATAGHWRCRMPHGGSSDRSLGIRVAYTDAESSWYADVAILPAPRVAVDRAAGVRFRLAERLLTVSLAPQPRHVPADARLELWGKRIRAVCATRSNPRRATVMTQTRRWPKGRKSLTFGFRRDIAQRARWCLVEHTDGGDIAVVTFRR